MRNSFSFIKFGLSRLISWILKLMNMQISSDLKIYKTQIGDS